MWILLWITIGSILGAILGFGVGYALFEESGVKWKSLITRHKKEKYLRRGLLDKQYTMSNSYTNKSENFEVSFEVGELERTDKKSKIYVIDCHVSASQYSDEDTISKIKKLVDNTWVNSSDVEWISPHTADVRNDKLDKILN